MSATRTMRLAFAVVALFVLVGCQTELNQGLSESEANDIVALLLGNGIPASRQMAIKEGTMTVFVERDRFAEAVSLLKSHGLPKPRFANTGTIFTGGGLINSPTEERARMVFALEQELSETLSQIDGVLTARVHVVLPEVDRMRRDISPSSAAVFLRYDSSAKIDVMVPQIKTLVANSVEGLSYNTVSVVLLASAKPSLAQVEQKFGLVQVAGIWVDRNSVFALQAVMGGVCLLILTVVGMLGWRARVFALRFRRKPADALALR